MLRSATLCFGPTEDAPGLHFPLGHMTVFVGPNNSGKSLALRELEDLLEQGGAGSRRIVARVEPHLPSPAEAERMLLTRHIELEAVPIPTGWVRVSRMKSLSEQAKKRATDVAEPPVEHLVDLAAVRRALEHAGSLSAAEFAQLCRDFLTLFTVRLDGQTRLALTQPRLVGDLQRHPANHLAALFRDDDARARIREITADALGMYFVIDPTGVTHFRIRMSDRPPHDAAEEQGLDARAQAFHGRAPDIVELSDGVRAFTGLTAAVLSADYRIMLVDEPEAFLHPPLTRKLGRRLTELAAERGANVVAATHSPDFVMGCIQAGKGVNIVRLTYRKGVPSARLLAADQLQKLMRDPLLRSTGVLGALFHEGAIVCEADADRVFYQEVNERLLAARGGGADGCVFLNAQNKQTIRRIIHPLRGMGIPAAAVVDLDLLKGRDDFRDLLRSALVPSVFWEPWEEVRSRIQQKLRNEEFKAGGIRTLPRELREQAQELLESLCEYGIFLVPSGELESWLPELEVGGHGPDWLTGVFDRMGTDPLEDGYQRPGGGGVWRFMERVADWIADPRRRGMGADLIPLDHRLAPSEEEREAREHAAAVEARLTPEELDRDPHRTRERQRGRRHKGSRAERTDPPRRRPAKADDPVPHAAAEPAEPAAAATSPTDAAVPRTEAAA